MPKLSLLKLHMRTFVGRAWPNFTVYARSFGIVRGSYFLGMSRVWPRSNGRLALARIPGHTGQLLLRRGTTDVDVFADIYVWQ